METARLTAVSVVFLGVLALSGCQGPAAGDAASALPSIDPDQIVRGDDGFGTYPTLNDEVVCHTAGGHLTTWQTPRTYDWDKGTAGGALKGNRNREIEASELPDLFATYHSGTAKAFDDRIEFYDYRIDGNNYYATQSKDASITLNGTLHCTVFIDESGVETPAGKAPSASSPSSTPSDSAGPGATVNTPAQAATEYYQSQGRGDYVGTCLVIDPQLISDTPGACALGFEQMYEQLLDPELAAFLSTYVVPEEGTVITGTTATVVVAPGPKWTTTTTIDLVLRGDRWYVDYSRVMAP